MQNRETFASFEATPNWEKNTKKIGRRKWASKALELVGVASTLITAGKVLHDRGGQPKPETNLPKNAEDVAKFLSVKVNIHVQTILTEMEKLKQPGVIEFIYNNVTYILKVEEISDGRIKKANLIAKINRVV